MKQVQLIENQVNKIITGVLIKTVNQSENYYQRFFYFCRPKTEGKFGRLI